MALKNMAARPVKPYQQNRRLTLMEKDGSFGRIKFMRYTGAFAFMPLSSSHDANNVPRWRPGDGMTSVLILCAATWGELGNLTAARRLGRHLEEQLPGKPRVVVQPIEEWCELFAITGRRMRTIAAASADAAERRAYYMALIDELQLLFPAGFEKGDVPCASCDLDDLADRIRQMLPDVIVGTKGIICRVVDAAIRRGGLSCTVVNYVTNDGLLTLPLHRPCADMLTMVQTEFGRAHLPAGHKVEVVGPLVGRVGTPSVALEKGHGPLIAVLCNRAPEYRALFEALIGYGERVRVCTIIIGCPELLADIRRDAPEHWQVWDARAAEAYLSLLSELGSTHRALLCCKSSPNTVFEALAAGVPVFTLSSGLPMEEWVSRLVGDHDLGWAVDEIPAALATLDTILANPGIIDAKRAHASAFSAERIDNRRNGQNICKAITSNVFLSDQGDRSCV